VKRTTSRQARLVAAAVRATASAARSSLSTGWYLNPTETGAAARLVTR